MKQNIQAVKDIKCFVLDMDGTIYLGNDLFPFTPVSYTHLTLPTIA